MKKTRSGFILKIEREGDGRRFRLHDLRSGERRTFTSWEELREHLEAASSPGLR